MPILHLLVSTVCSSKGVFTHSSVLQQGVAVMFFSQEVIQHVVMALASSVPQRYPTISSLNLKTC